MAKARASKTNPAAQDAARYQDFVAGAAAQHKVWGLWRDGWALSQGEASGLVFPLWASLDHAKKCATGPWKGFEPEEIPAEDLLEQLLPQLARDGVQPGISPLPDTAALTPPIAKLLSDLESALGREEDEE